MREARANSDAREAWWRRHVARIALLSVVQEAAAVINIILVIARWECLAFEWLALMCLGTWCVDRSREVLANRREGLLVIVLAVLGVLYAAAVMQPAWALSWADMPAVVRELRLSPRQALVAATLGVTLPVMGALTVEAWDRWRARSTRGDRGAHRG